MGLISFRSDEIKFSVNFALKFCLNRVCYNNDFWLALHLTVSLSPLAIFAVFFLSCVTPTDE